jgi:hypothetical protein
MQISHFFIAVVAITVLKIKNGAQDAKGWAASLREVLNWVE